MHLYTATQCTFLKHEIILSSFSYLFLTGLSIEENRMKQLLELCRFYSRLSLLLGIIIKVKYSAVWYTIFCDSGQDIPMPKNASLNLYLTVQIHFYTSSEPSHLLRAPQKDYSQR